MFLTHRYELNELATFTQNVTNFQVLVEGTDNDLNFLFRASKGGANSSDSIEAASGRSGHPRREAGSAKIGSAVRR